MTLGGGLLAFALGAALGGVGNIYIDRSARAPSPRPLRPACPACRRPFRLSQTIPLAGYLIYRGRCSSCGGAVPWRAPLVELSGAALGVACYASFGLSWGFFSKTVLLVAALTAAVIDARHQIIPNTLTLPGLALGLLLSLLPGSPTPVEALVGLAVAGGLLGIVAWAYPQGMGGGDVKFMAMAGAFLGWAKALVALFLGSLVLATVGLALVGMGRRGRKEPLAFGPFLSLGVMVAVFGDLSWIPFF